MLVHANVHDYDVDTPHHTRFDVRLDNATNVRFGPGAQNVLTLRADASFGSGHWYEGGGIYRLVNVIKSPSYLIASPELRKIEDLDGVPSLRSVVIYFTCLCHVC